MKIENMNMYVGNDLRQSKQTEFPIFKLPAALQGYSKILGTYFKNRALKIKTALLQTH